MFDFVHAVGAGDRPPTRPRHAFLKDAGWAIGDQALASASNLLVNVMVARSMGSAGFGAFGLAFSAYILLAGVLRSLLIEPFTVGPEARGRSIGPLLGRGLAVAAAATVVLAPLAYVALPLPRAVRLVIVATVPVATMVEVLRSGATASGAPRRAAAIDATWLVAQVVLLLVAASRGAVGPEWAIGTWSLGATAGCVTGLVLLGRPRVRRSLTGLRDSARLGGVWVAEFLVTNGTTVAVVWIVGAIAVLDDVAALRGAIVLLGPATVLLGGLRLIVLRELAERQRTDPGGAVRRSNRCAFGFGAISLLATAPILVVPHDLGRALLGESWSGARQVAPWLIVFRAVGAATTGPLLTMRVLLDRSSGLTIRVAAAVLAVCGSAVGATVDGARGAAIALAGAGVVTWPLWQVRLHRLHRRSRE